MNVQSDVSLFSNTISISESLTLYEVLTKHNTSYLLDLL